jgi:FSR family fosmidomycin resistance protein-like MFS transporter
MLPFTLLLAGGGITVASIVANYWAIALCVGLSGIGIAAFHPEAARLMYEMAGKRKATGMSMFSLGGNIGFALGPLVITVLLLLFGLYGTTVLILPLALMAAILAVLVKSTSSPGHEERNGREHHSQRDHWWAFSLLTGAIICRSMMFYGLNTFLPLYWIGVLHQSKAAGGTALSVLLFAGLVGTALGGRLADRFHRRRVVLMAFILLLPCFLLFVLLGPLHPMLAWVLLVPVGLSLFAPFSVMVVMGQEYLPNHVGTASGVTLGLALTVGGIAAPLLGRIADLYGLSLALSLLALMPLLGLGCAFSLPQALPVATDGPVDGRGGIEPRPYHQPVE